MPANVRKVSDFPISFCLISERLRLELPAKMRRSLKKLRRQHGKAQPFRTSGGIAAIVSCIFKKLKLVIISAEKR